MREALRHISLVAVMYTSDCIISNAHGGDTLRERVEWSEGERGGGCMHFEIMALFWAKERRKNLEQKSINRILKSLVLAKYHLTFSSRNKHCSFPFLLSHHSIVRKQLYYLLRSYAGPNLDDLESSLQSELTKYMESRGITEELSQFIQDYVKNVKEPSEYKRWLNGLHNFVKP